MEEAVARANSNVALIQAWGARVPALNLPYTGSISMTLEGLPSTVRWQNRPDFDSDRITVNEQPASGTTARRLQSYVDLIRNPAGRRTRCAVSIETAAGRVRGVGATTAAFA